MKKRSALIIFASLIFILLTACGEQSKEDVVKKLEEQAEKMSGYKTDASMTMNTGKEQQKYHIEVWHKKKDFYRVKLQHDQDEEGSQIILKNKEGVFVLTPALNKSFKFQSEWPQNSSQPYLYESLVQDILKDSEAEFSTMEDYYVFKTKTNYQNNKSLPFQEIYFDKKTYQPVLVKVFDQDMQALVEVQFGGFTKDPSFKEEDFDVQKNMAAVQTEVPVMNMEGEQTFTVRYPAVQLGAELAEKQEVDMEAGKRVIMTYKGDKSFTIIEEQAEVKAASTADVVPVQGEPVNLGFTIGAINDNTLEWNYKGMKFRLASNDLTREEMIEVAGSVYDQSVK
ncbi:LolA family protein [Thalassobacillus pellis]|uniref:LolA family protein n=1 Tax=Thalassobacillus pellis TaxID=748008 RepID=UPI00196146B7|nr:outer membrane lipoprotein carrier protein LolA [Thalassobacillus pellis]MBM7554390.1 outer membrane lipoprotein-sorting protein [Thalassobacillus pellis]